MKKVVVMDGQGGGIGRGLVEQLKALCPQQPILAVGANSLATAAMLRAGADQGATGENAAVVNARDADLLLGPVGILLCDGMLGEITPAMAAAVGRSPALKILVPVQRCQVWVAGVADQPLGDATRLAAQRAAAILNGPKCP